jgi:hypothetical protein
MTLISVSAKNLGDLDSISTVYAPEGWVRRFRRGQVGKQKIVDEGPRCVLGSPGYRTAISSSIQYENRSAFKNGTIGARRPYWRLMR